MRPIAMTTGSRSRILPDTPTMIEQGVNDYDIALWNGLFVPRGTPQAIIGKLSVVLLNLPALDAMQQAADRIGTTLTVSRPEELGHEIPRRERVVGGRPQGGDEEMIGSSVPVESSSLIFVPEPQKVLRTISPRELPRWTCRPDRERPQTRRGRARSPGPRRPG